MSSDNLINSKISSVADGVSGVVDGIYVSRGQSQESMSELA